MENAQKIQSLLGGNPMIKNVLSNPEHMKNAQKMLQSPDVQKQIGGLISNPKVIQQASQVLSGLQQINSTQAGGRKSRRRKGGGEKFDEIMDNGKAAAVRVANEINKAWKENPAEHLGDDHKVRIVTVFKDALELGLTDLENKNDFQNKLIDTVNQIIFYHNAVTKNIQTKSKGETYLTNSNELKGWLEWFDTLIKSAFKYEIITKEEKISLEPLKLPYLKFSDRYVKHVKEKQNKVVKEIENILKEQPDQGGRKKRRRTKKKRRRKRTKKKKRRRKSTKKRRRRKSRR